MTVETPMLELADVVLEIGGEDLKVCMQCGTCTGVCPWGLVADLSPRQVIRLVSLGLEGYEQEDLWKCVTCGTCVTRCPRGIDLVDVWRAARAAMQEGGMVPREFRGPLGSLRAEGNPWDGKREDRLGWVKGIDVPVFSEHTEHLLHACCTHAYDARYQAVLRELTSLLLGGGLSFGVIGTEESCCGDQAQKTGALETFDRLRDANNAVFDAYGVSSIITTSPHCLNAFRKDYGGRDAVHYTQVLDDLITRGRLTPTKEVPLKVAYHDPCYLGRHNKVYEPPRRVLQSIPGLEYIELPRNRERSLCCGGGGGGLFREIPIEQRFAVLRIKEARAAGAEVIATACPYCTIMLDDGLKALGIEEDTMRIMEVAELLHDSVE